MALNLNVLTKEIKQWEWTSKMLRPVNQADPGYTPNPRASYYGCGMSRHNMRNYPDIKKLINKRIIHWDSTDKLCWRKEDSDEIWIHLMHKLLWKNDIFK